MLDVSDSEAPIIQEQEVPKRGITSNVTVSRRCIVGVAVAASLALLGAASVAIVAQGAAGTHARSTNTAGVISFAEDEHTLKGCLLQCRDDYNKAYDKCPSVWRDPGGAAKCQTNIGKTRLSCDTTCAKKAAEWAHKEAKEAAEDAKEKLNKAKDDAAKLTEDAKEKLNKAKDDAIKLKDEAVLKGKKAKQYAECQADVLKCYHECKDKPQFIYGGEPPFPETAGECSSRCTQEKVDCLKKPPLNGEDPA